MVIEFVELVRPLLVNPEHDWGVLVFSLSLTWVTAVTAPFLPKLPKEEGLGGRKKNRYFFFSLTQTP